MARRPVTAMILLAAMTTTARAGFLLGSAINSPGFGSATTPFTTTLPTVQDPGVEFTFVSVLGTRLSYDFADLSLTVTNASSPAGGIIPIAATFVDAAFVGLDVVSVSPGVGFEGLTASIAGATLTVLSPATPSNSVRSGTFTFAPRVAVPEPASLTLCGVAVLAGLGSWARRRRPVRT